MNKYEQDKSLPGNTTQAPQCPASPSTHISLFSGIGGFSIAAEMAGFQEVLFCEIDEYCQSVLAYHWPGVPIIKDVRDVNRQVVADALINRRRTLRAESERQQWQAGVEQVVADAYALWEQQSQRRESNQRGRADNGNQEATTDAHGQRWGTQFSTVPQNEGQSQLNRQTDKRGRQPVIHGPRSCFTDNRRITLLTAGVPCQPASVAGKRRGAADDRWLWPEAIRVLGKIQPLHAVFENPTGITSMVEFDSLLEVDDRHYSQIEMASGRFEVGRVCERQGAGVLDTLMGDIEAQGYTCETVIVPACAVNAPHRRDRVFIIAHSKSVRQQRNGGARDRWNGLEDGLTLDNEGLQGRDELRECAGQCTTRPSSASIEVPRQSQSGVCLLDARFSRRLARYPDWAGGDWQAPPPLAQSSKGRVNKLKALGNAVVPFQVLPILTSIFDLEQES